MAKDLTPLVQIDHTLVVTTFDKFTDFEGELTFEHSLKINGRFSGSIKTTGFLYIGKTAELNADVEAGVVILEGTVRGNILAHEKIEMLSSGKLYGDLQTAKLQISDGVVFEGGCKMIKGQPAAPEPVKPKTEEKTQTAVPI